MAWAPGLLVARESGSPWRRVACWNVVGAAFVALVAAPGPVSALDYELKRDFLNTEAEGRAGQATAVVGAYLIVGVPGQNRVHVYDRLDPSAVPTPVKTIVSPTGAAGDDFGAAVAPNGDTEVLIGAPLEDTLGGVDAGAVYLYDFTKTPPMQIKRFERPSTIPGPAAGGAFGSTIAVKASVAIGAPGEDEPGEPDSGAVYLFLATSPYPYQLRLANPTPDANDRFGASLLAYSRAAYTSYYAIGAPNDSAGSGALYEFFAPGFLSPKETLVGAPGSQFGFSVAIGPTISIYGITRYHFLVGAPTGGENGAGEVLLVDQEAPHTVVNRFIRPGGVASDLFGYAVGRLNDNFVISAPGADVGATNAGEVYVFKNTAPPDPDPYGLLDTIANPTPGAEDRFGISVAGPNRLVVGANGNDVTPSDDAGGAYLYEPEFATGCWTSGDPATIGQWDPPKSWPAVAVHMVLLHTPDHKGKVLFFQGFGNPYGYLWDPVTQAVTNTGTIPGPDIFCAGHATLADGRALLIGGTAPDPGSKNTVIFDPAAETYTQMQNMHLGRFYPTATTLGDGRVLATEGAYGPYFQFHATTPEVFDPALGCWRNLEPNLPVSMATYPFMFLLPDGKFFQAGPSLFPFSGVTRKLTLSIPIPNPNPSLACSNDGSAFWEVFPLYPNPPIIIDGYEGSAVLYRAAEHFGRLVISASKVLKAGGVHDGEPTDRAEAIDVSQTNAVWTHAASMNVAREHVNLVLLPTGKVLAVGGNSEAGGFGAEGPVLGAEVWDPNALPQPGGGTWTKLACMSEPRMYHSTALLLPDGSVLSAGGGTLVDPADLTVYPSFQVYKPPYMFASRPQIVASSVPTQAGFLSSFDVSVSNVGDASEIDSVVFIRPGAVTHSFDQNQRYVPATFHAKDATTITVTTPKNNKVAPAGYYMMFIVKDDVPSTAVFIRLEGGGCE